MGIKDFLFPPEKEEMDSAEVGYDDTESANLQGAINQAAGPRPQGGASNSTQYVLVRPEEFNDSISIANHIIDRKTVVLNLDSIGKELARRILDVLSGTAYAVGAKIKNVSVGTYLIIPCGSEFTGDNMNTIDTESFKLD